MAKVGQDSYPTTHKGQSCIICGAAPSLLEEFNEAKKHRPDAVVIAVNETTQAVHADHLMTMHYDKMNYFKAPSLNKNIITHSGMVARKPADEVYFNSIDYVWNDAHTAGTSGVSAMLIAMHMGFDEIILCGMPLEPTGYFNEGKTVKHSKTQPRFGYLKDKDTLTSYHENGLMRTLENFPRLAEISRSLGGFTKRVLGGPSWQQT